MTTTAFDTHSCPWPPQRRYAHSHQTLASHQLYRVRTVRCRTTVHTLLGYIKNNWKCSRTHCRTRPETVSLYELHSSFGFQDPRREYPGVESARMIFETKHRECSSSPVSDNTSVFGCMISALVCSHEIARECFEMCTNQRACVFIVDSWVGQRSLSSQGLSHSGDSLVRTLLNVSCIQMQMATLVLQKLPEFVVGALASQPVDALSWDLVTYGGSDWFGPV